MILINFFFNNNNIFSSFHFNIVSYFNLLFSYFLILMLDFGLSYKID